MKHLTIVTITTLNLFIFQHLLCVTSPAYAQSGPFFWQHWGGGAVEFTGYSVQETGAGGRSEYGLLSRLTVEFLAQPGWTPVSDSTPTDQVVPAMRMVISEVREKKIAPVLSGLLPLRVWHVGERRVRAILPVFIEYGSGERISELRATADGLKWLPRSTQAPEAFREVVVSDGAIVDADLLFRVRELLAPFPSGSYELLNLDRATPEWERVYLSRDVLIDPQETPVGRVFVTEFVLNGLEHDLRFVVERTGEKRVLEWSKTTRTPDGNHTTLHGTLAGTRRGATGDNSLGSEQEIAKALGLI